MDAMVGQLAAYNTKCAIQIGEGQSCAKCCILRKTVKNTVFNVFDYKGFISCFTGGLWTLKCTMTAKTHWGEEMKLTSVMLCAFLVVLAGAGSGAAYAATGKIIIKAPDPTCPPPQGTQLISFDGTVSNLEGTASVNSGSVPNPVDGSTSFADNEFANCTGQTLDVLTVTIDDIPLNEQYIVLLSGDAFDGFSTGPISNSSETLKLYCDPGFFGTACDGLSGVAGQDNGVSFIVATPEPAEVPMLLFGIGGVLLLGLKTRKDRKQLRAAGAA